MSSMNHSRNPSIASVVEHVDPLDPTSTTHFSLSRALNARRSEYTRSHRIRIKIGTWNVANCPGTDKDLASWFVDGDGIEPRLGADLANLNLSENSILVDSQDEPKTQPSDTHTDRVVGGDQIGLYVLGLQEIVNLSHVTQSLYSDPSTVAKWQDALEAALPRGYTLVTSQQLVGLLLLVYASPDVAATISNESNVSIGTGLLGYMGNKGAVVSRLLLGETTRLVFSNCHLASGHDPTSFDRRCWDYNKIMTNTKFAPINHTGVLEDEGDKMGDEEFAFFFGDLNFRLDGLPGNDIRHLLTLHARGEYDISKAHSQQHPGGDSVLILHHPDDDDNTDGTSTPSMVSREASFDQDGSEESSEDLPDPDDFILDPHEDPASLQATLDSLLPHDQLRKAMKDGKAFHEGWREGPVTFLPTYKYDIGTVGLFDSSEKKRAPSWCDRILFRTRKDTEQFKKKHQDYVAAKIKDEEMRKLGMDEAAEDESVLFDYEPTKDASQESLNTGHAIYDYDEYDEEEEDDANQVITQEGFLDEIHLDLYTSHQRITSSDHKPLVAVFTLKYDAIVPELKAKVHAEVARELDRVENEGRPVVTIVSDGRDPAITDRETATDGSGGVDFGNVGSKRKKSHSLTVANTGRVAAKLNFVGKPEAEVGDKSKWLDVKFVDSLNGDGGGNEGDLGTEIALEPGETVNVLIEVEVSDLRQLRILNENPTQLEDVLVLRVVDGRDHFIPIRATWQSSCFGRSLEELIRIPKGGIKELAQQHEKMGSIPSTLEVQHSSPTELFKLIEAMESLTERLLADEAMIDDVKVPREKAGWPFDKATWQTRKDDDHATLLGHIIEALEEDRPVLEALRADVPALKRLELVSEALLLFLESMPDGLLPAPLWALVDQALPQLASTTKTPAEREAIKTGILDILSTAPYYNISFVFLTSMLARVGGELLPLHRDDRETVPTRSIGRRSLSFLRSQAAEVGVQRRLAWERRTAEIFGVAICRAGREKKVDERVRVAIEVFMRRDGL